MAYQLVGLGRTTYRHHAKPQHDQAFPERRTALAAERFRYGDALLHGLLKIKGNPPIFS